MSNYSLFQATNGKVGYFFASYTDAKALASDMQDGKVLGLKDQEWIEIKGGY